MSRRFLVIGSGGREHAIARQLAACEPTPTIFVAPGNPGCEGLALVAPLDESDHAAVAAWCRDQSIDTVIVGPEDPLIEGLADAVSAAGVPVFGPGAEGARLEGDKHHAKELMAAAGVPTARYDHAHDLDTALALLDDWPAPVVVKACGAAQGKGVAVCTDRAEAEVFLKECFEADRFGAAGQHVLLEECMVGPELSVLAITDGRDYALLAPSRDHKRVGEGDTGPNTGGMGAFASGRLIDPELAERICGEIVEPVMEELRRRGTPYRGVLYVGLMLTDEGPRVLEFNCRFGDPETQVVLPLLARSFADLVVATARGELGDYLASLGSAPQDAPANWPGAVLTRWDRAAVVVVGAAGGYPGSYAKGTPLVFPADEDEAWIIHAGTRLEPEGLVASGGRVLGAVGLGDDFPGARARAYGLLANVDFEGMYHRRDIGAGFEEV